MARETTTSPRRGTDLPSSLGRDGQLRYCRMERKSVADIGLVGLPNAGKSSFLAGVSRCKTAVGHWAFTTLNPYLGTIQFPPERVHVQQDGSFRPARVATANDSPTTRTMATTATTSSSTSTNTMQDRLHAWTNQTGSTDAQETNVFHVDDHNDDDDADSMSGTSSASCHLPTKLLPPFTMSIADIPGIIEGAAEFNRGLGHSFLRHIEKSRLLVFILDLTRPEPWMDLQVLLRELEIHQPGMTAQKRTLIVANKADVNGVNGGGGDGGDGDENAHHNHSVQATYHKLKSIVHGEWNHPDWQVIPISAKERKNVTKVLWTMRALVEESRREQDAELRRKLREEEGIDWTSSTNALDLVPLWNRPEYVKGVYQIELPPSANAKGGGGGGV